MKRRSVFLLIVSISLILISLASTMQYKSILAMIFNEIKRHVNTSLGLVGGMHPPLCPRLDAL